ncbi:MAG: DUF4838 domain-containing protein, partial [bacterium]|nr:DUF4838 domain-containing protein [bacterium]
PNYGYLWPYPSWFAMCTDYPIAYANGVRAVYRQGTMIGRGAEFTELRAYLSARMAWDPHTDHMQLYDEFMDAYYGPAAPHIRAYMEWYAKRCEDEVIHSRGFWGEADAWKYWVDDDVMRVGDAHFRAALDAVSGTEPYEQHVRASYLPILFARILSAIPEEPTLEDGDYKLLAGAEEAPIREAVDLFTTIMAQSGYNRWNEPTAYDPDNNPMVALLAKHPYHKLDNGTDQAYVLPTLGGRVVRWHIGALDGNVFRRPQSRSGDYPSTGGYEEYMRFHRGSPGIALQFDVVSADARRIELRAMSKLDVEVVRTIELAADAPELSVSTTYTNRSDKPLDVGPRTHPEFAFDLFKDAALYYVNTDGTWAARPLYSPEAPTADTMVSEGSFSGTVCLLGNPARNMGLVNRFDPDVIRTVYAYWSDQIEAINLEIWGRSRILQPGGSYTFEHSYEYVDDLEGFLRDSGVVEEVSAVARSPR